MTNTILFFWMAEAILTMLVAEKRHGWHPRKGFLIGLIFGVFGLLYVALIPRETTAVRTPVARDRDEA